MPNKPSTETIQAHAPEVGELLTRLNRDPWALRPEAFDRLLGTVLMVDREPPELQARLYEAGSLDMQAGKLDVPRSSGTVAVVPIVGVIDQRRNYWGNVFTDELGPMLDSLVANESIGAIVLDVDSPGGSVSGVPELAEHIRGLRGTKPIYSISNPQMASAAYWLGTAADKTFVTPSGEVGSIGVWTMHIELTKMLEEWGVKITGISAGKYKVEGNWWEPLGDEAKASMQADVDAYYGMFLDAVAKNRGRRSSTVQREFGEGRMVMAEGTEDNPGAVKRGMADGIATLPDLLGALVPKRRGTSVVSASLDIALAED